MQYEINPPLRRLSHHQLLRHPLPPRPHHPRCRLPRPLRGARLDRGPAHARARHRGWPRGQDTKHEATLECVL